MEKMVIVWLVVIVASILIESITSDLVSIWFVVGGIGGLIAEICGADSMTQVTIAVIVSALCLFVTRPIVKRKIEVKKVSTNADRYIGQKGIVIKSIDNVCGLGEVKVKGSIWTARSENSEHISEGSEVRILSIEGVKLIVEPFNSTEAEENDLKEEAKYGKYT